MGSVSEANALVPDPNVAVPEGTLPASGVAGEALQEAEPKSLETVDAGNPPEPGQGEILNLLPSVRRKNSVNDL